MTGYLADDNLPPGLTSAHPHFYDSDIPEECPCCEGRLEELTATGCCPECGAEIEP